MRCIKLWTYMQENFIFIFFKPGTFAPEVNEDPSPETTQHGLSRPFWLLFDVRQSCFILLYDFLSYVNNHHSNLAINILAQPQYSGEISALVKTQVNKLFWNVLYGICSSPWVSAGRILRWRLRLITAMKMMSQRKHV